MATRTVRFSGYIELEEEELPAIGSRVHANIVAEVDGEHTDRKKRRGGKHTIERSAPATILDESRITRIEAPAADPELFEGDDGDDPSID